MAAHACIVANPKSTDVTVGGKTALANRLTQLSLDDTVTLSGAGSGVSEQSQFVAGGCAVIRADVDTQEDVRKNVGFLFTSEEQIIAGGRP